MVRRILGDLGRLPPSLSCITPTHKESKSAIYRLQSCLMGVGQPHGGSNISVNTNNVNRLLEKVLSDVQDVRRKLYVGKTILDRQYELSCMIWTRETGA